MIITAIKNSYNKEIIRVALKFKARIEKQQYKCKHFRVGHWAGDGGYSLEYPLRVCMNCGLEEEGSWWSYTGANWSQKEFKKNPLLGNRKDRTIEILSKQEIQKYRFNI